MANHQPSNPSRGKHPGSLSKRRGAGRPHLGVDIGRVLIVPGDGAGDTSFLHGSDTDALKTQPMPHAFEALAELVERLEGRVWLVSKCGPRIQARTLRWLRHWSFYQRTGVREDRVLFCKERHQKAGHCERHGITHFVDDRLDVLGHLRGLVGELFLYGPQRGLAPDWVQPVADWETAELALNASLDQSLGLVPKTPTNAGGTAAVNHTLFSER